MSDSYTKKDAQRELLERRLSEEKEMFGKEGEGDKKDREEFFDREAKTIESAPELVVFTAFELTDDQIRTVGARARELFGEKLFLDFKTDPSLLAGAALAFGGQYRDYSLKARFEEKKEEIREIYFKTLKTLK